MPNDRRWSDADRELVADAIYAPLPGDPTPRPEFNRTGARLHNKAGRVLDALTAAGWEPRCDCDGVAHDLPILRSHIRGEPGCMAAIDAGCLPEGSGEGSTDA